MGPKLETLLSQQPMSALLVSVRSVGEADAALSGGAAVIDVKEPNHGSLGRASDETIAQVIRFVANRTPVSAALGELLEDQTAFSCRGLSYIKWGLAGCGRQVRWPDELERARSHVENAYRSCRPVAVAYADWPRATAPPVSEVLAMALGHRLRAILLDTWCKDGSTLLDWLSVEEISNLCSICRTAGIRVALAGALGLKEIQRLSHLQPTWFAVRSAVCRGKNRQQSIDREAVRELASCLASAGN
jgi:uncharacterized protein (UPF0264 family)